MSSIQGNNYLAIQAHHRRIKETKCIFSWAATWRIWICSPRHA